jgi:hypothetical protein
LFEFNMFTECDHFFLEVGLEDEQEFWKLCNVRLIGQYGQRLDVLEEEYLQDCECYPFRAVKTYSWLHFSDFS